MTDNVVTYNNTYYILTQHFICQHLFHSLCTNNQQRRKHDVIFNLIDTFYYIFQHLYFIIPDYYPYIFF